MIALTAALLLTAAPSCPHPYFPMEEGLRLTYRTGARPSNPEGGRPVQLRFHGTKKVAGGLASSLSVKVGERQGATQATCGRDGIRTEAGGLEGVVLKSSGMDVKVLSSEGVVFPPAAAMEPGKPWSNSISVELSPPTQAKLPGQFRPVVTTTFSKESEVVGKETITVEAGTFEALKLKNKTTAQGSKGGHSRAVESFVWIAPKVGILKIQTGDSTDLELIRVDRKTKSFLNEENSVATP